MTAKRIKNFNLGVKELIQELLVSVSLILLVSPFSTNFVSEVFSELLFKRGCQHPSNKFEILWQVAQNSFSLLLSYFVAQYALIIVVWFFVKINFSFREMIFFVRPLKYANFQPEYYPSCVTSGNEFTWPAVFVSEWSFVLSSKFNPLSLLKLQRNIYFLVNIFVR